ncbi:hypothetical protein FOZ62_025133, partial [Perkinsus olseni]
VSQFLSVIANVDEHLNERWSLQILTSHETASWLSSGLDVVEGVRAKRRLVIRPVPWPFNHDTINKIMFNASFWEAIEPSNADKVLVFQSDSVMCGSGDLDDFLEYDYIGAPWKHRPLGLSVGNGGFSLRSRSLLMECIRSCEEEEVSLVHCDTTLNEG